MEMQAAGMEAGVAEAQLYGHLALQRHLQVLSSRPLASRPRLIEYGLSSMGQL